MITFIAAMYEEARPFIEILGLKKRADEHHYQYFVADGFEVIIVGEGLVSALRNCSRHFAIHEPSYDDLAVNVGICGSSSGNVGDLFLINKITDDLTGKTYYPDLLYKNDFTMSSMTTVNRPASEGEGLYDMEASMVYEALTPYFTLERIFFFKVISDVFDGRDIRDKNIDPYGNILKHAQRIIDFVSNIRIEPKLDLDDIVIPDITDRLCLTETMRNKLKRIIFYRRLNGMDTDLSFIVDIVFEDNSKESKKEVFDRICDELIRKTDLSFSKKKVDEGLFPPFTNIYAEKDIEVLFKNRNVVRIDSYKDIFNRSGQNFDIQKRSPALILARQRGQFIYKGARVCQDFGNDHFYYCSCMMNCIFDCKYCYLCGMYPTGNVVAFMNFEDILKEIDEILKIHPMYLCVSYDTDLLAVENMFGFVGRFIEAAKSREDLTIEIRTKSGNPGIFSGFEPSDRIIFAWTLSPDKVTMLEDKAAPLDKRLEAMKACSDLGFKVRVCFDPVIYYSDWEKDYLELVDKVFNTIAPDRINDVSIGVFRLSSDQLKLMRRRRPDTPVTSFPFKSENGVAHYGDITSEMISKLKSKVREYIEDNKIFVWEEGS
ncbi:MAG: hypothetical protein K6F83_07735 [Clostridiales bacterium]|nr:hypothetical protein [Clostridiales bacterium]